jgi:GNAT superfamily N-acetyltransferase
MGSTELQLREEHLAGCLALSSAAHWNQNEADWRLMLGLGRGWGVMLADGTLAATTVVLPYGSFAWVSMVLVLPEHRGKGYATRLLRLALADLKRRGQTPILDATPAGHEVYVQEGFRDTWGFRRYALARKCQASLPSTGVRTLQDLDWSEILALDAAAFGASREALLRTLAQRLPAAALVCERQGRLSGFLLGRDGREARQLGPLVARDALSAQDLLTAALSAVVPSLYIDLVDREGKLRTWLETLGFAFQRPFTRMVRVDGPEAAHAPGDASLVFSPAGPELG